MGNRRGIRNLHFSSKYYIQNKWVLAGESTIDFCPGDFTGFKLSKKWMPHLCPRGGFTWVVHNWIHPLFVCDLKIYRFLLWYRVGIPRKINRSNLKPWDEHQSGILGKGCFGTCTKMDYRGIPVAVKQFQNHVKKAAVLEEASRLSKLDNPGMK